jgi:hypothetical protein
MGLKRSQILEHLFNLGRKTWLIEKQKLQQFKKIGIPIHAGKALLVGIPPKT